MDCLRTLDIVMDTLKQTSSVAVQAEVSKKSKQELKQEFLQKVSDSRVKLNKSTCKGDDALRQLDQLDSKVEEMGKEIEREVKRTIELTLKNVKKTIEKEKKKLKPTITRLEDNQKSLKKSEERIQDKNAPFTNADIGKIKKRLKKTEESLLATENLILTTQVRFIPKSEFDQVKAILKQMTVFGEIIVYNNMTAASQIGRPDANVQMRVSRSVPDIRPRQLVQRSQSADVHFYHSDTDESDADSEGTASVNSCSTSQSSIEMRPYNIKADDKLTRQTGREDNESSGSGFAVVACGTTSTLASERNSNSDESVVDGEPTIFESSLQSKREQEAAQNEHAQQHIKDVKEESMKSQTLKPPTKDEDISPDATDVKEACINVSHQENSTSEMPISDKENEETQVKFAEQRFGLDVPPHSTEQDTVEGTDTTSTDVKEATLTESGRESPLGASFNSGIQEKEKPVLDQESSTNDKPLLSPESEIKDDSFLIQAYDEEPKAFGKEFLRQHYAIQNTSKASSYEDMVLLRMTRAGHVQNEEEIEKVERKSNIRYTDTADRQSENRRTVTSTETQTEENHELDHCSSPTNQTYPKSILKKRDRTQSLKLSPDVPLKSEPGLAKSVSFNDVHVLSEDVLDAPLQQITKDPNVTRNIFPRLMANELMSDSDESSQDSEDHNENYPILLTVDFFPGKFDADGPVPTIYKEELRDKEPSSSTLTVSEEIDVKSLKHAPLVGSADRSRLHIPTRTMQNPLEDDGTKTVNEKQERPTTTTRLRTLPVFKKDLNSRTDTTHATILSKPLIISDHRNSTLENESQKELQKTTEDRSPLVPDLTTKPVEVGKKTTDAKSNIPNKDYTGFTDGLPSFDSQNVRATPAVTKEDSISLEMKFTSNGNYTNNKALAKPPLPVGASTWKEDKKSPPITARFRKRPDSSPSPSITRERPFSPKLLDLLPERVKMRLEKAKAENAKKNAFSITRERIGTYPSVQERAAIFNTKIRSKSETVDDKSRNQSQEKGRFSQQKGPSVQYSERLSRIDNKTDSSSSKAQQSLLSEGHASKTVNGKSTNNQWNDPSQRNRLKDVDSGSPSPRGRSRSTSPKRYLSLTSLDIEAVEFAPPSTGMDLQTLCKTESPRTIRKEFCIRQRRSLSATPLRRQQSLTKPLFVYSSSFTLPLGAKRCCPCGITIVDNRMTVVVDQDNKCIHLFAANFAHLDTLMTKDIPGKLCAVDRFSVAVSFPYKQMIQILDIFHKVRKESEMKVSCTEWVVDICYKKGYIFALCKGGHIHVLDERGREARKIDCGVTGQMELNYTADRIFINEQGRITCFNMNGKTMWSESKPQTSGVLYYKDKVYVIDKEKNKIGSVYYNELTTADLITEELEAPHAMCISSSGDKVLVTQYAEGLEIAKARTVKVFVLDKVSTEAGRICAM